MSVISRLRDAGVECYTREQWDSPRQADGSYAKRRLTHPMPEGKAPYHFLHITVTSDTDTVMEGAEGARQIERYGYSSPPMVSYHDLITNEGRYYQGQSYGVKGTHTQNDKRVAGFPIDLNLFGYATALMQNVWDEVSDEQVELAALIAAARELEGFTVIGAPIYPHRMFSSKGCPGDKAVARLQEIRDLKIEYVRHGMPTQEEEMKEEDWDRIRQIIREEVDASNEAMLAENMSVTTPDGGTRNLSLRQLHREVWQRVARHV
jgi:hypothetical protein